MRAYVAESLSGIDGLVLKDMPPSQISAGHVRVRLRAASLNARDLMVLGGAFAEHTLPNLIPLSDAAGEVVEVGDGVWRVKPGDRVTLTFNPDWIGGEWEPTPGALGRGGGAQGVLREEIVVHQNETVQLPPHLSFEEGAALPCAAVTAWSALTIAGNPLPGESVLVQGTGGVSIFALQFAKLFGMRVVATTSSAAKMERLRALGADEVIDYAAEPDWESAVLGLTGGQGVDRVVEISGGASSAKSIAATRQGGSISLVGLLTGPPEMSAALFFKGLRIDVVRVGSRADFVKMNRAIAFHKLKPVIDRVYAFNEIGDALRQLQAHTHIGKIVIRID